MSRKNYIKTLFTDNRNLTEGINLDDCLEITKLEYALPRAKNGKASEPDDVRVEVLKVLRRGSAITLLLELFNCIYKTGFRPLVWLKSTFVTLPKNCAKYYYRTRNCSQKLYTPEYTKNMSKILAILSLAAEISLAYAMPYSAYKSLLSVVVMSMWMYMCNLLTIKRSSTLSRIKITPSP